MGLILVLKDDKNLASNSWDESPIFIKGHYLASWMKIILGGASYFMPVLWAIFVKIMSKPWIENEINYVRLSIQISAVFIMVFNLSLLTKHIFPLAASDYNAGGILAVFISNILPESIKHPIFLVSTLFICTIFLLPVLLEIWNELANEISKIYKKFK